jgi:hypothetical protein
VWDVGSGGRSPWRRRGQPAEPRGEGGLSDVLGDPGRVQPADLLERLPELARLVDVDLARLLGVRLAELLADAQGLDPLDEDTSLRREIGRAVQAQVAREGELVRVEEVGLRVVAEIEGGAAPLDLEGVGLVWQARQRRAVVGEGEEVLVLAHHLLGRVGCGPGRSGWAGSLGGPDGRDLADAARGVVAPGVRRCDLGVSFGAPDGLQVATLPLQPVAAVHIEGPGDLGLELEGEGVLALARRRGLSKQAGDAGRDVLVDHALSGEGLVVGEERCLELGGGRLGLRLRVEDGVADDDGRQVLAGDALEVLGGGRDGWRDREPRCGEREEGLHLGVYGVLEGSAGEALVRDCLGRRHEAGVKIAVVLGGHVVEGLDGGGGGDGGGWRRSGRWSGR